MLSLLQHALAYGGFLRSDPRPGIRVSCSLSYQEGYPNMLATLQYPNHLYIRVCVGGLATHPLIMKDFNYD